MTSMRIGRPAARAASPEGFVFEDARGTVHPLNDKLRYSLKETWRIFSPLSLLAELKERGVLDEKGTALLSELRGTSTITVSLDEMISGIVSHGVV